MKLAFIVPPHVELLDLAGPVQVFTEARLNGYDDVKIEFYSYTDTATSTGGLGFGKISNFREANMQSGDYVFIPGMNFEYVSSDAFSNEKDFFEWLKDCSGRRVYICSVCNAAFALGEAGLLDGRECTTHWRRVEALQLRFPRAIVIPDILYAKSDNIYTSAGISAGIDLALSVLEDLKGPRFVHTVARGLVVYHRRSQNQSQQSVYLDFRNHINPRVHNVQDYILDHLSEENSVETLAEMVAMSPRNLTRVFKDSTGITIVEFLTRVRKENAKTLLNNPDYTIEYVASQCGFKTARQLQRILK
ncbi:MAG: helix-turn-helix domain-containing protein [Cyclobacteriaceae bacterium]|nr:helix-turn-helix domain-containing protein [Cyclobacteriaceae bacterium]MDH4298584.1 helix-turn-helix domain-containing protein [Cyclobacteriaceae bacterium]MDH5251133.1 helix-turn-helix domain-containing protein [Cyclobacteriaceae bacterium]